MRQPDHTTAFEVRHFIDAAVSTTGLSLDQLAERLDYKSLRRIRAGEFPLPDAKRRHIEDLMQLAELERERASGVGREEAAPSPSADVAMMDDEIIAETLAEMIRGYNGINAVFAKSARAQIEAVYQEWKRRAEHVGRTNGTYLFPKPAAKGKRK